MKKFVFFIFLVMFAPFCVMAAEDHVYSIDMNIYIDDKGTAFITEIWDVRSDNKNDWCKIFSNLENVELNDISVLMDDDLSENDNSSNKKPRYTKDYVPGGVQICFGYKDTERHKFMLEYEIDDYVLDTEDSQVLYHVLAENVTTDMFYADIVTYYRIPDDLDLRAPGFVGSAYVDNGRIVIANFDGIKDQYVTVLAKFPLDTFSSTSKHKDLGNFEEVLEHSKNEKYKYPDYTNGNFRFTFIDFIFVLLSIFVIGLIIEFIVRKVTGKSILEHEKVKIVLDKITPIFKKVFGKIIPILKKVFSKVLKFIKKIFINIKDFIKNKIGKKKGNNM